MLTTLNIHLPRPMVIAALVASLAFALGHGDAAAAAKEDKPAQSAATQAPTENEAEETTCRRERITGSRKTRQVCHTSEEWAAMRRHGSETVRVTQQKATMHFENEAERGGGGGG